MRALSRCPAGHRLRLQNPGWGCKTPAVFPEELLEAALWKLICARGRSLVGRAQQPLAELLWRAQRRDGGPQHPLSWI